MGRFVEALVSVMVGTAVLVLISSCRDQNLVKPDRNRAPETFITGAPRELGSAGVRVHFYWRAWDEDGSIVRYEVAIDDTSQDAWFRTTKSDSIFLFRVEQSDRDVQHTFYVAAVDNEQKRDPTPASRTFTAVDREPPLIDDSYGAYYRAPDGAKTFFANGDTVPALPGQEPYTVDVSWTASDADGEVVKFFTQFGEDQFEAAYQDTTTFTIDNLPPKEPDDRTEYLLSITAEDDAGLHGGGGIAGVEPFRFRFTVDFTPRIRLRQVVARGTRQGVAWNPTTAAFYTTPPETLTYSAATLAAGSVTFPAGSIPEFSWSAFDPEETCVKDVRWEADPNLLFDGSREIREYPWQAATCDGDSSRGVIASSTVKFTTSAFSSSKRIFLRARDSFLRRGEYGLADPGAPIVNCFVNFLPTVTIDSVIVRADSVLFTWYGEDRDDGSINIKYEVSLDGRSFNEITVAPMAHGRTGYGRPTQIGSGSHDFRVRTANNLSLARYTFDDTTFVVP